MRREDARAGQSDYRCAFTFQANDLASLSFPKIPPSLSMRIWAQMLRCRRAGSRDVVATRMGETRACNPSSKGETENLSKLGSDVPTPRTPSWVD